MSGIQAKFAGTCAGCGGRYEVGEMIDKIPGTDNKRGHVRCAQGGGGYQQQHNHHSNSGTYNSGDMSVPLESIRVGLMEAIDAAKLMEQGYSKALQGVNAIIASKRGR